MTSLTLKPFSNSHYDVFSGIKKNYLQLYRDVIYELPLQKFTRTVEKLTKKVFFVTFFPFSIFLIETWFIR